MSRHIVQDFPPSTSFVHPVIIGIYAAGQGRASEGISGNFAIAFLKVFCPFWSLPQGWTQQELCPYPKQYFSRLWSVKRNKRVQCVSSLKDLFDITLHLWSYGSWLSKKLPTFVQRNSLSEMLRVRHVLNCSAKLFQITDVKGRQGSGEVQKFSFLLASTYHRGRQRWSYALEKQKITPQVPPRIRELLQFALELRCNLSSFSLQVGLNISQEQKNKWRKYPRQFLQRISFFRLVWGSSGLDLRISNLQQTAVALPLIHFHPCVLYSRNTEHTRQTAALRHSP